jgi:hypothetical protein
MPIHPLSPAAGAQMRQRYLEGVPVSRILAEFGVSLGTLYFWVDGGPTDAGPRLPPLPRRRPAVMGKRRRPLKTSRVSLVARLWRTAERQVRDIEERLALNQQDPPERERDARMLAILVKTLRELSALDALEPAPAGTPDGEDDMPRDIDEFRHQLTRKVEALIARRDAGADRLAEP